MKGIFKILLALTISVFCTQLEAQEIIITTTGDLFLCNIGTTSDDSISYSFTLDDQIHKQSIPTNQVAYHGENIFMEDGETPDDKYQQDLIVTNSGEIIKCRILSYIASPSIEYAFRWNENEMKNFIKKKEVAFYTKSYRQNVNLIAESQVFYRSLVQPAATGGFQAGLNGAPPQADSTHFTEDLIVTVNGNEFTCYVNGIDLNTVRYSFYLNNRILVSSLPKTEVYYLVKGYMSESPKKIILTPESEDLTQLIITDEGVAIDCFVDHVGKNTVEYYINVDGEPAYQIKKANEVLYHGSNFLDVINPDILKQEGLGTSSYNDLILTQSQEVLLCNIDYQSDSSVKYSFKLNKQRMMSFLSKADIIYAGRNFVKIRAKNEEIKETPEEAQEEIILAAVDQISPEVVIVTPALSDETSFEAVADEVRTLNISGVILDSSPLEKILVNSTEAEIGNNGKFSVDIELKPGINPITIVATDIHHNRTSIDYTVERIKPLAQPKKQPEIQAGVKAGVIAGRDTEPPEILLDMQEFSAEVREIKVKNTQKSFKVSGSASDQTGVYEVLVNGRDAVLSSNGDFNRDVMLKVGDNKITVQATDLELNFSTYIFHVYRADASVSLFAQPSITGADDKFYALIIGISDYPDPMIPNLDMHPTRDAKALSELLVERYRFAEENMLLLLNPDRVEILKSFDRLSRSITENDNLLIFFAGHGYYDQEANLGYWLPSDAESDFTANWIYNDVLVANLKRIHSKHTLLITDACFSGSIFKTRSLNFGPVAYKKKYELRSRKAITSGVLEAVPNESVFFKYLLDRLDSNAEKYMSASELFTALEFPVSNNSPNSPQYGTIQNVNDEGGDFIFIKK